MKNEVNNQAVPPQNDAIMEIFFLFESVLKIPSHETPKKTRFENEHSSKYT